MGKPLFMQVFAAILALGTVCAAQTTSTVTIPVPRTASSDGKQMFTSYCAPCHGVDGRGNGPVAPALKTQPIDLTRLSRNNQGKFPDIHVMAILQFGANMPAHGTAQMPVWGPILSSMNHTAAQEKQLRISNLTRYLETIQVK